MCQKKGIFTFSRIFFLLLKYMREFYVLHFNVTGEKFMGKVFFCLQSEI